MLRLLVDYMALVLVTPLWLGGVNGDPLGRLGPSDERYVEYCRNATLVVHKMHAVVTFDEPMSRLDHGFLTFFVIFGDGARGNCNHSDTGMIVPSSRTSGLDVDPYVRNVCRMVWAL